MSDTVDDLADLRRRASRSMEVEVGVKADYLMTRPRPRRSSQVRLIPKPDKYYLLEAGRRPARAR